MGGGGRARGEDTELSRSGFDTGKLYQRLLRDRYWGDQEPKIV